MPMKNPPHPGDLIRTEIVKPSTSACRRRRRFCKCAGPRFPIFFTARPL